MIDSRAVGGAWHLVMVNGVEFSRHTTDYKASERAYDLAVSFLDQLSQGVITQFPQVQVLYDRRIVFEVDPSFDPGDEQVPPPPSTPPKSDGGLDVMDWWDTYIDPIDPNNLIDIPPAVVDSVTAQRDADIRGAADRSRTQWRPVRTVAPTIDGGWETVAVCWRGYKLIFDQRDKTAIKIGVSS